MRIDPVCYTSRPAERRSEQEEAIYDRLEELGIPFLRADHDAVDTMEACRQIELQLKSHICKNLFLCNRQQTQFYLLILPGDKPFKTKYLSSQIGCARLSFADAGHMALYLRCSAGSVSALELLFDTGGAVRFLIDEDLLEEKSLCFHPGFSTSTLRISREDLLKYVRAADHEPILVDLPGEMSAV